ncbi:MAG: hypothetical protein WB797_06145 [Nocardioides sp.]
MRLRHAAVAGALSASGCLMAACGLIHHSPRIVDPSGGHLASEGRPSIHRGDVLSIGMESTLCLDRAGTVQLKAVEPLRPVGVRVIGFGLRPNQNWKPTQGTRGEFLGMERAPLRHFGFTGRTVGAVCDPKTAAGYELAVRVEKTGTGPAQAAGWKVNYVSDGHAETVTVPLGIYLCPDHEITPRRCPEPDMSQQ